MAENEHQLETLASPYEIFGEQRDTVRKLSEMRVQLELGQGIQELERYLQNPAHPIYELPEGYSPALAEKQPDILERLVILTDEAAKLNLANVPADRKAAMKKMVDDLVRDIVALERQAEVDARKKLDELLTDPGMAKYRTQFKEHLKVGGSDEEFTAVLKYLSDPVPEPVPVKPDNWKEEDLAKLRSMHGTVSRRQYELIDRVINLSLLNLRDAERFPGAEWVRKFDEEDRRTLLVSIGDFMNQRIVYKTMQGSVKEKDISMLKMYALATGIELAEEYGEKIWEFNEPTKLTKAVDDALWKFLKRTGQRVDLNSVKATATIRAGEFWGRMSPELRASVLEGYQGAQKLLGASAPHIRTVANFINSSPVGKEFWNKLMLESPVTVVLFIIYVNQSSNKLKATMNFMSFLTLSAGTGSFMSTWGAAIWRQGILRASLWAKRAGNLRLYNKLRLMRLAPKNPWVQFVVVLAIAFGLSDKIDQFTTWLDEEVLNDGPVKQLNTDIVDFATSGSVVSHLLTEMGVPLIGAVNPQNDVINYLSTDVTFIGVRNGRGFPTLEREKLNRMIEWNEKIDNLNANEWNTVQRQLNDLEKADQGPWADRQSFRFFGLVQQAKQMQDAIATALVERGQMRFTNSFDLLRWAVDDNIDERPDDAVKRIEDDQTFTEGKMRTYIKSLSDKAEKDKELIKLWNDYRKLVDEIAVMTTTFRHLGIYDRSEWLGGNTWKDLKVGEKVQRGIAQEILHLMRKEEILKYREGGAQTRADFTRNIASLSSQEMIKVKVDIPWLKDLFTADGTLTKMESHYYKRSFIAAAEAAGIALPKDHDINALFQELRESVYGSETISLDQYMKIRDRFCDAVREYSARRNKFTQASESLTGAFPDIPAARIFYSGDIDDDAVEDFKRNRMPADWPEVMVREAFREKLEKERTAGRADIVLFQYVLPEWGESSHYKLAILTMTCIECRGENPAEWRVHTHRYQAAREMKTANRSVNQFQNVANWGRSTSEPYLSWLQHSASVAGQISSAMDSVRTEYASISPEDRAKREKAESQASESNDLFVYLPHRKEYRMRVGEAVIVLHKLPQVRWFNSDKDTDGHAKRDYGKAKIEDFSFIVREPGKPEREIVVPVEGIAAVQAMSKEDQSLIWKVVTTPIEGQSESSLATVLNIFKHKYSTVSALGYQLGYRPDFYYTELHDALLPLYNEAKDKKFFLKRLADELDWRSEVIDEQNVDHLGTWFKENAYLFKGLNAKTIARFEAGDMLLGYPDERGFYTHNADTAKDVTPLHYYFHAERGWLWSPGKDWSWRWFPLSQTEAVVRDIDYNKDSFLDERDVRRGTPSQPNLDFIKKLEEATK